MGGRALAKPSYTPPEAIDEYRLGRLLGQGAMGYVYLAEDTLLERPVAVKFIAQRRPDEEARRRFLAEARALARLSHPNVVTVHRAGEVEGNPFLVTELIRGKTLSELEKPLPLAQVLTVAMDLARGLAAAHKKGVLHRDIKPANAVLADDGDAKLIDFGLAVVADLVPRAPGDRPARNRSGPELAGTPLYMAPEVLRGEVATARSDIYSLGAVLYELYTGVAPRDTLDSNIDEDGWINGIAQPVTTRLSAPNLRFGDVVSRCIAPIPGDRFPSAEALADALAALLTDPAPPPAPEGNPYRGLAAFEAEHRALFFGRAGDARAIIDRLREHALVVVTGDSGAGKSSLCRAGVLPLVESGALADGRRYHPLTLLPGRRPQTALVAALSAAFSLDEETLIGDAREDPDAIPRALRRALGKDRGALLLVDQAEELITIAESDQALVFAETLARLPAGAAGVRVLVAVRGDFFTRLATLPGLGEDLARALYLLRPLSAEGMHAAIVGPAALRGVAFEPPDLVDALATAAGGAAGGLPLLQFTLAELWEARQGAATITPAQLDELGGVEGALTRHADRVLASLSPPARVAARRVLLALVTAERTRIRRNESELDAEDPASRAAIDSLVTGRLVVAREQEGETAYELAHEALLQRWDTLRRWLDTGGEARARRERLDAAAKEWERLQRAPDLLLSGKRLAEAETLASEDLSRGAGAFVEASRARARWARLRRWGMIAAGALALGAALGGLEWKQKRDLDRLIAGHMVTADAAHREGQSRKAEAEAKRVQAYALFDAAHGPSVEEVSKKREEAEVVWSEALGASREAEAGLVRAGQALEAALALDPARSAIRGAIGDVTVERLGLAESFHVEDRRADLLLRLAAYDPEGTRMALLKSPPSLSLTTSPAGAEVTLERYDDEQGRKVPVMMGALGKTPLKGVKLDRGPGSYRLTLKAPGRVEVKYPVLLGAGERFEAEVALPSEKDAPPGYVYVPEGRFLLGSAEPEPLRKGFMVCPPLHEAKTKAFWVARTEVTFGEWIRFLEALPAAERKIRAPFAKSVMWGIELSQIEEQWRLILTLNGEQHVAMSGERMRIQGRSRQGVQVWENLPVAGISIEDAETYFRWLNETGKVPGARLCDEREWEHAARGADARLFPHGDLLRAEDADFDQTYQRQPLAFGPDEVGSHRTSESPFGLWDMAGNVYEVSRSIEVTGDSVMRGGTWYYDSMSAMIPNRTMAEQKTRDHLMGFRGCAAQ